MHFHLKTVNCYDKHMYWLPVQLGLFCQLQKPRAIKFEIVITDKNIIMFNYSLQSP